MISINLMDSMYSHYLENCKEYKEAEEEESKADIAHNKLEEIIEQLPENIKGIASEALEELDYRAQLSGFYAGFEAAQKVLAGVRYGKQ